MMRGGENWLKTKTLALILVVLAVLAPVTYVLAASNSNGYSYNSSTYGMMGGTTDNTNANNMMNDGSNIEDQDWWDEMLEYMEDRVDELNETTEQGTQDEDFEDWWDEMTGIMEDHFGDLNDEEWFDEMKAYMEDHWDEIKDEGWFNDMTAYMEDHMGHFDEDWWEEMENHMEEHWEELEDNSYYRYGHHGCH
jgi:hypothetical protein